MILKEDVAILPRAESLDGFEFAERDGLAEFVRVAVVFEHFFAVEPVLDLVSAHDDMGGVPLADGVYFFGGGGGEQVVKRGERAVAVAAEFGIGVMQVVENLVFVTDGGAGGGLGSRAGDRVEVGLDEIFDAAVRPLGDFEIGKQLEARIPLARDDVASPARFLAAALVDGEHAVVDRPAGGGEFIRFRAAPAIGGLAVPEEFPAFLDFLRCEGVRSGSGGGVLRVKRCGGCDEDCENGGRDQPGGFHRGLGQSELCARIFQRLKPRLTSPAGWRTNRKKLQTCGRAGVRKRARRRGSLCISD